MRRSIAPNSERTNDEQKRGRWSDEEVSSHDQGEDEQPAIISIRYPQIISLQQWLDMSA